MKPRSHRRKPVLIAGALTVVIGLAFANGSPARAAADPPGDVPYSLPVQLPTTTTSPAIDATAPYTPVVLSLIAQLEAQGHGLANADSLLFGGPNPTCNNVGPTPAPLGTTPSIMAQCWTDAQGVNVIAGPNQDKTTGPADLMSLGASFDPVLANAWGQTEGREARELMVTGIYGPQGDIDRRPDWGRDLSTTGEDPYLSNQMVAAQVNGMQGAGTMSQVKHLAGYNGQNNAENTVVQDQALHEVLLPPYEGGLTDGDAAAAMCSYQIFQDASTSLPANVSALDSSAPSSPYASGGTAPSTWPLNESHYACEQPLSQNYVVRDLWGSPAMIGSDYPAIHSTSGIEQGSDQEMPGLGDYEIGPALTTVSGGPYYGTGDPNPVLGTDPTGDTCAADLAAAPCSSAGSQHVGGIPGLGCPSDGCGLVTAVETGHLPLSVFNQSLARILYQEQRFGMLGCTPPVLSSCTNPGGVAGNTTGTAALPGGPARAATPQNDLGTKNGDAALVEKESEEGAVLLKNVAGTLPLSTADLSGGVMVTGPGAEYLIADPTTEAALGYADRDAISPLEQLKTLSNDPKAFTYEPALSPSGEAVPSSGLSTSATSVTGDLARTSLPPSATSDKSIDFTTVSGNGQLQPGHYTWTGYLYVPRGDSYTFRFQLSSNLTSNNVSFTLDGSDQALTTASPVNTTGGPSPLPFVDDPEVQGSPTDGGYTEAGLLNLQTAPTGLTSGSYHAITITFDNTSAGPASFRFAYSRARGDIDDAAAAAAKAKVAIVFADDNGAPPEGDSTTALTQIPNPYGNNPATIASVETLPSDRQALIEAVAAANPNTIVVLNTTNPVLMPWLANVKAVLEMWYPGQEGGTSTARLLLGQADPGGHLPITFPAHATDTIWAYDETTPLYPGDTLGPHLERLNGGNPASAVPTDETEGIYSGYRFFDKEGITPLFPFGYGLSYTKFTYSNLTLEPSPDGGITASFTVRNTGTVPGSDVPQVYVGPPTNQPADVQFAVRQLAQFSRITLAPGQSQRVNLDIAPRQLSYWSTPKRQWILDPTGRSVYVGDADSLASLPLQAAMQDPARPSVTCDDTSLNASIISGSLDVPSGDWCDLVDMTIDGDLTLDHAIGVRIVNSTITGSIIASATEASSDPRSSASNLICGTTIGGDVDIHDSTAASPWNLGSCAGNNVAGCLRFSDNAGSPNSVTGNQFEGGATEKNSTATMNGNKAGTGRCKTTTGS